MNALVTTSPSNAEIYRASTDAAGLCREIVLKTAQNIQGRKYVKVEGWQAIAIAHGCTASAEDVERVTDEGAAGYRAQGVVRRMSDGALIARAEGFLGDDEQVWAKRPVYARRAMVQTRAISRACRSAFAHVVVLIDSGLSTTPAEEVPDGGFDEAPRNITPPRQQARPAAADTFPGDLPPRQAKPAQKPLSERADDFEVELREAAKQGEQALNKVLNRPSAGALDEELERHDPERKAAILQVVEGLWAEIDQRVAA